MFDGLPRRYQTCEFSEMRYADAAFSGAQQGFATRFCPEIYCTVKFYADRQGKMDSLPMPPALAEFPLFHLIGPERRRACRNNKNFPTGRAKRLKR